MGSIWAASVAHRSSKLSSTQCERARAATAAVEYPSLRVGIQTHHLAQSARTMLPRLAIANAGLRPPPPPRRRYVRGEKQPKEDRWLFYVVGAVLVPLVGYIVWKDSRKELRLEAEAAAAAKRAK